MSSLSFYEKKRPELEALLIGHWLTDLSNFAAFVFAELPDLNWAGFYLWDDQVLRLGPFCGRPACTEIAPTHGVCGHAFTPLHHRRRRRLGTLDTGAFAARSRGPMGEPILALN